MANKRIVYKPHTVSDPNTYTIIDNGDGTSTLEAAFGIILSQGTPLSSDNLNNSEGEMLLNCDDISTTTNIIQVEIEGISDASEIPSKLLLKIANANTAAVNLEVYDTTPTLLATYDLLKRDSSGESEFAAGELYTNQWLPVVLEYTPNKAIPIGGGAASWGNITGDISNQTDLQDAFVNTDGDTMTSHLTFTNNQGLLGETTTATPIAMIRVNTGNQVRVGNEGYPLYLYTTGDNIIKTYDGTNIYDVLTTKGGQTVQDHMTWNNNVGPQGKTTGGTDVALIRMNTGNQVRVGEAGYPLYLYTTSDSIVRTYDGTNIYQVISSKGLQTINDTTTIVDSGDNPLILRGNTDSNLAFENSGGTLGYTSFYNSGQLAFSSIAASYISPTYSDGTGTYEFITSYGYQTINSQLSISSADGGNRGFVAKGPSRDAIFRTSANRALIANLDGATLGAYVVFDETVLQYNNGTSSYNIITSQGGQTISGDLTLTGNMNLTGTSEYKLNSGNGRIGYIDTGAADDRLFIGNLVGNAYIRFQESGRIETTNDFHTGTGDNYVRMPVNTRNMYFNASSGSTSILSDWNMEGGTGSHTASFRFHRSTNTTGNANVEIYAGNNTTTRNILLEGKTGNIDAAGQVKADSMRSEGNGSSRLILDRNDSDNNVNIVFEGTGSTYNLGKYGSTLRWGPSGDLSSAPRILHEDNVNVSVTALNTQSLTSGSTTTFNSIRNYEWVYVLTSVNTTLYQTVIKPGSAWVTGRIYNSSSDDSWISFNFNSTTQLTVNASGNGGYVRGIYGVNTVGS